MKEIVYLNEDNTPREIGFKFQYLLAVEQFFNYIDDEDIFIQIEREGDISLWKNENRIHSIEIKHSINYEPVTDSSVDFWNTIANVYKQELSSAKYPKYTLITNRKLTNKYNSLRDAKKKKEFIKNTRGKSNGKKRKKSYFLTRLSSEKKVYYFEGTKLKEKPTITYVQVDDSVLDLVISKFEVRNVPENYFELKRSITQKFIGLTDEHATDLLNVLIGYISEISDINDNRKTSIKKLKRKCQEEYKKNYGTELELLSELPPGFTCEGRNYIKELEQIKLDEKRIERAQGHYNIAMYNKFEIISKSPYVINRSIETFESELLEHIELKKEISILNLNKEQQNYLETQSSLSGDNNMKILNVRVTPTYQRGSTHILVEENKFKWRFDNDD